MKKARKNILYGLIVVFFIGLGTLYAAGGLIFPGSTPGNISPNLETRFSHIKNYSCPGKSFVKGFNGSSHTPLCVSYQTPTSISSTPLYSTGVIVGAPANTPGGEVSGGKFGVFLKNLSGLCSGSGVLQGLTTDGQKTCVDAQNRSTVTENPSTVSYGTLAWPTQPSEATQGGNYQTFFINLFQKCNTNQGISGFDANGKPICTNIPVDAKCGSSDKKNLYTIPTTDLCSQGTPTPISGTGPWTWTCIGVDG